MLRFRTNKDNTISEMIRLATVPWTEKAFPLVNNQSSAIF